MNRNKNQYKGKKERRPYKSRNKSDKQQRPDEKRYNGDDAKLEAGDRNNNPNWYFLDKGVAEMTSQLAFQQLAGYDIKRSDGDLPVANIVSVYYNPCPGTMSPDHYNTPLTQREGINLSGFRTFQKLAAFTGRTASYGPNDISIMILALGEVISMIEWVRRAFGVSMISSMRNRAYPKQVLQAMHIDADDMFTNLADYRMKFNSIITRVNQIPIPRDIAYFDKCASMYEKIYLDSQSPMSQTIVPNPATTWILDETSNPQGSMLHTMDWTFAYNNYTPVTTRPLSYFLTGISNMVDVLMGSSTLNIVYTDLLNLATKMKTEFWKFDYLTEGYVVMPEFNANFLLQFHNTTFVGGATFDGSVPIATCGMTPYNDVYPNGNQASIYYNPGFVTINNVQHGVTRCPSTGLIDATMPELTVEDRIEITRFLSVATYTREYDASGTYWYSEYALPDHYATGIIGWMTDGSMVIHQTTNFSNVSPTAYQSRSSVLSRIDWAPFMFQYDATSWTFTGYYLGDLNNYTVVDYYFVKRLHEFVTLALYDLR